MQLTANPNASPEAKKLLNYLSEISGQNLITGQHTQTNPMEEIAYIKDITGREPLLRGFELLSYSPNINYADSDSACLTEINENKGTLKTALKWAKDNPNGIVTFSFHWFSPISGRDKSFYSKNTDFNPKKVLKKNTDERKAFFEDMDKIAEELKVFRDENIPVLWRPFHESYGKWFWWGRKGNRTAMKLYKLMYEHYTKIHKLNNLLWVWNSDKKFCYPGDDMVDVVSIDVYLQKKEKTDYKKQWKKLVANTSRSKVCALAEIGYLPDIDILRKSKIPWAYFMLWSKEFCIGEKFNLKEEMKKIYADEYTLKG